MSHNKCGLTVLISRLYIKYDSPLATHILFKKKIEVIATEKWYRVMTVPVRYPDTWIPGTVLTDIQY